MFSWSTWLHVFSKHELCSLGEQFWHAMLLSKIRRACMLFDFFLAWWKLGCSQAWSHTFAVGTGAMKWGSQSCGCSLSLNPRVSLVPSYAMGYHTWTDSEVSVVGSVSCTSPKFRWLGSDELLTLLSYRRGLSTWRDLDYAVCWTCLGYTSRLPEVWENRQVAHWEGTNICGIAAVRKCTENPRCGLL